MQKYISAYVSDHHGPDQGTDIADRLQLWHNGPGPHQSFGQGGPNRT